MTLASIRGWLRTRLAEVPDSRIVVAVSGGADSVALATALTIAAVDIAESAAPLFIFAHFDHGLRDRSEHDRDLAVVSELARNLGVPLATERAQAGEIEAEARAAGGIESAARASRYRFFGRVCRAVGARTVCTAHHADDQVETVLMRLLAGQTGVQLAGIPNHRELDPGVLLCRPLLKTRQTEIDSFLADQNLQWSDDRTNADPRYRRNLVRSVILPAVEREWPAIRHDLVVLAASMEALRSDAHARASSVQMTVDRDSARVERGAFYRLGREARLDLAYEVIRRLALLRRDDRPGHRFFEPLLGSDPGSNRQLIASRGIRVRLEAGNLVFERDIVRPTERRYLRGGSREG